MKTFFEDFFFWRTLATVSLVLGLERVCLRKGCPWPLIFFCVLGLEPCVFDSTSALYFAVAKIMHSLSVTDPENFGGGGFEAQNLKNSDVFTKIESDFSTEIRNSNVFFAQNQVVSKKKKKKVFTKIESDFSAGFVTFSLVGGMHPEMEPNYSK